MTEPDLPRVLVGEGEADGWILVWHTTRDGKLKESRFRSGELTSLIERLLGVHWGETG